MTRKAIRINRSYGMFQRTVPLCVKVKDKDAKTLFKNGVLEIVIPKEKKGKTKKVKVETE
ncbi:MAG: Hsp20 family protein [Actinomycetia bacterium]|nr:Hsp20 family protein [Actinomycetes bacterium]